MSTSSSSQFLGYLHSFRGFAIINIVLIHAVVAALVAIDEMDFSNLIALTNEVLFHDSTLYFTIISGLLFSAILRSRGYKAFYKSKAMNVLAPYAFITLLVALGKASQSPDLEQSGYFAVLLNTFGMDMLYGKAIGLYWYLPVLFFLFIITPLVDYLINLRKIGIVLMLLMALAPLLVSRVQMAFEYILPIESFIYFLGAYALGIWLGTDLDKYMTWIKSKMILFLVIAAISTVVLFYLFIKDINMVGFVSLQETFFYIQKMALAGIVLVWMKDNLNTPPRWLDRFAKDSFGIYFIHGYLAFGGIPLFMWILGFDAISPFNTLIGSLILFAFSVGMSMGLIWLFRKMMGKRSRMLVGS